MRAFLILLAALVQFGPRPPFADSTGRLSVAQGRPLTPAETLLEPLVLRAIDDAPSMSPAETIKGSDTNAGEIWITCYHDTAAVSGCPSSRMASGKLRWLVEDKGLERPARTIRFIALRDRDAAATLVQDTPDAGKRVRAAIHIGVAPTSQALQIFRSPWSRASITDEVVELFARQAPYGSTAGAVEARPFVSLGQPPLDPFGVPTQTLLGSGDATFGVKQTAFVTAAAAYFLATMPNAGSEALLSHLTVGAHARLAEDARKAVAQMGTQQRASADVLIMFGQAIEREQRRMRSFERFMPAPVDPILHRRILDMEKGITSVWTSMGITNSPFVPAAQRIRGRGGEDRRIVTRVGTGALPTPDPPTALLKFQNSDVVIYELGNFIDGKRSISDIRDAVSAEFGPIALPVVVDYFERLAKTGAVAIR